MSSKVEILRLIRVLYSFLQTKSSQLFRVIIASIPGFVSIELSYYNEVEIKFEPKFLLDFGFLLPGLISRSRGSGLGDPGSGFSGESLNPGTDLNLPLIWWGFRIYLLCFSRKHAKKPGNFHPILGRSKNRQFHLFFVFSGPKLSWILLELRTEQISNDTRNHDSVADGRAKRIIYCQNN
jgi:hypothetical protein